MGLILIFAIGNFANSVLPNSGKISATVGGFVSILFYMGVISFFLAGAFVGFRYYRFKWNDGHPAQVGVEEALAYPASSEIVSKMSVEESILTLVAENGKDKLTILPQHLCYIEADDNYVTVVFQEEQKIRKELLRSSLGRIESQIRASHIRRCHRSYMVNLQKVYRVSGNAQGYKLHLWQVAEPLPVSRGYAKQVILSA
ncbi:LytR/AlgR family response regulator transcription factor [Runella aurantiaca]|nr:LytTR family DNA-binding domain-containing protein [Runella aurantiaca]